jgi:hypothetical protein
MHLVAPDASNHASDFIKQSSKTMSDLRQRIDFLKLRMQQCQDADWVEVIFGAHYSMTVAKDADGEKYYVGMSDMPGVGCSRWVAQDFVPLGPMLRNVALSFMENRLKELEGELKKEHGDRKKNRA